MCLVRIVPLLFVTACASVTNVPEPSIYIRQVAPRLHQAIFFEGPVPIECEVWISNVAQQPLELTAVELHSGAKEPFAFTSHTLPVTTTIPAGGTVTFNVSLWGWSRGGDFRQKRPLPLAGRAWFSVGHTRPHPVAFRIAL